MNENMTTRTRRARRAKRSAGFTLVELGAVVAIVGILAVVAVLSYRKYLLHSKITEAQNGLSAIKIAQEDYRAERGRYANLGATWCPTNAGISEKKVGWDPECTGGTAKWKTLPVHINGAVQFQYATVADVDNFVKPTGASFVGVAANPTGAWYAAMAQCDLDGDTSTKTQLATFSFSNEIFIDNAGL